MHLFELTFLFFIFNAFSDRFVVKGRKPINILKSGYPKSFGTNSFFSGYDCLFFSVPTKSGKPGTISELEIMETVIIEK